MNIPLALRLYRASAFALCLFASNLSAQGSDISLEFLPGLASDGSEPVSAMVQAKDGALYGTTSKGGLKDRGTLYRVVPGTTPSVSTIYSFGEETYLPKSPMVVASDGNLYGVTSGWSKLYRLTPGTTPTVELFPFPFKGGNDANGDLVQANDGTLYGTIPGDQHSGGGIYQVVPGAKPTIAQVWTFKDGYCSIKQKLSGQKKDAVNPAIGAIGTMLGAILDIVISPAAAMKTVIESCRVSHLRLVVASDGNLYGATQGAGQNGLGGVFYRVIPGKQPQVETIFAYDGKDGSTWAPGPLIAAKDGNLYGSMTQGGLHGLGTIFAIKPGAKPVMNTLLSIKSPEFMNAQLAVAGRDGRLYGISSGGAKGCGSTFVLTPEKEPALVTLLSFDSEESEDVCKYRKPEATLVEGVNGALYGTLTPNRVTMDKDAPGGVFRVDIGAKPSATRILSFTQDIGYRPVAALVATSDGNLYGTTIKGAAHNDGSVFQFSPSSSKLERLFSFDPQSRVNPRSALAAGADGNLYGAVRTCCRSEGFVFSVQTGTEPHVSTLDSFYYGHNAGEPDGPLIAGTDGYLYGLKRVGGTSLLGSIYRVKTGASAAISTLFEFNPESGTKPYAPLIVTKNGRFYGTTSEGGSFGMGTIFEVTPGATKPVSVLYSFDAQIGRPDTSGLIVGADGQLYGSTYRTKNSCGTIFRLARGGQSGVEILHTFESGSCWRHSRLVTGTDGLYMATTGNSSDDDGKIFKVTLGEQASVTRAGSFSDDNRFHDVQLFSGGDGNVFGLAHSGGAGGLLFQTIPGDTPKVRTLLSINNKLLSGDGNFRTEPDSMMIGKDGNFYFVSEKGGLQGLGALLRYRPGNNSIDVLHSFSDTGDGAYPSTPLIWHSDGYIYGMTLNPSMRSNGRASLGRVFRFRPPL